MERAPSLPIYPLQLVTEEHRAFITYLPPAVPTALETMHYLYTDSVGSYLGYLIPKKTKRRIESRVKGTILSGTIEIRPCAPTHHSRPVRRFGTIPGCVDI